jgi:hypothetical protein
MHRHPIIELLFGLLGLLLALLIVHACGPAMTTQPVLTPSSYLPDGRAMAPSDVCPHIYSICPGSASGSCELGLGSQLEGGLELLDLGCAMNATSASDLLGCKGIRGCP